MLGTPKRGNFAVGREAQHVDEDELDHRTLSSGEHNFYCTLGQAERQQTSKDSGVGWVIMLSFLDTSVQSGCDKNAPTNCQGCAAHFTNKHHIIAFSPIAVKFI